MHVGPVIAVSDLEAAREFYEGRLGLTGRPAPGGWRLEADGGTVIYLLPGVEGAGRVDWPVASFAVDDVVGTVRRLREAGVPFLEDIPFDLDEDGISSDTDGLRVAWMRDPDGSVLTVFALG